LGGSPKSKKERGGKKGGGRKIPQTLLPKRHVWDSLTQSYCCWDQDQGKTGKNSADHKSKKIRKKKPSLTWGAAHTGKNRKKKDNLFIAAG